MGHPSSCGRLVSTSGWLTIRSVLVLLLLASHCRSETRGVQAAADGDKFIDAHSAPACILQDVACTALGLLKLKGYLSFHDTSAAARDFGLIKHFPPAAVLYPNSVEDVAALIRAVASSSTNLTVAAKGPGHSINGQAQADKGIVIEMSSMRGIKVMPNGDDDCALPFVEATGGELWVDVLEATLKEAPGLAPNSWTDYLYLSVGGTLSNAGVSGQTFRHGPQISNVLQLEVVTGKGEIVICSPSKQSELFYAVLGGLGQFGIITKARIIIETAPEKVRWMRAMYSDFEVFKKDQEMLISVMQDPLLTFDFIEGFVVMNNEDPTNGWKSVPFSPDQITASMLPPDAGSVLYLLEITLGYNLVDVGPVLEERVEKMLAPLNYIRSLMFSTDVSYFKFLNRIYDLVEVRSRALKLWDAPHPWLNLFVPASSITTFDSLIFKELVPVEFGGPILVYPVNRDKWDSRAATVVPDEEVFYLVAFLRNALPSGPVLESILEDNARILSICEQLRGKQYLPRYIEEAQWKQHFGADQWQAFVQHKLMFDPQAILAPGQNIFPRNPDWMQLSASI